MRDLCGGDDPAAGHVDVEQAHVGLVVLGRRDRLVGGRRLGHHEAVLLLEGFPHPRPGRGVVVGDDDPQ